MQGEFVGDDHACAVLTDDQFGVEGRATWHSGCGEQEVVIAIEIAVAETLRGEEGHVEGVLETGRNTHDDAGTPCAVAIGENSRLIDLPPCNRVGRCAAAIATARIWQRCWERRVRGEWGGDDPCGGWAWCVGAGGIGRPWRVGRPNIAIRARCIGRPWRVGRTRCRKGKPLRRSWL